MPGHEPEAATWGVVIHVSGTCVSVYRVVSLYRDTYVYDVSTGCIDIALCHHVSANVYICIAIHWCDTSGYNIRIHQWNRMKQRYIRCIALLYSCIFALTWRQSLISGYSDTVRYSTIQRYSDTAIQCYSSTMRDTQRYGTHVSPPLRVFEEMHSILVGKRCTSHGKHHYVVASSNTWPWDSHSTVSDRKTCTSCVLHYSTERARELCAWNRSVHK